MLHPAAGLVWWPGLPAGAWCWPGAGRVAPGRVATEAYAPLVEAAVRLHAGPLAGALGVRHAQHPDASTGWALTCVLQGQSHLVPLTVGWPPDRPKHR